MKHLNFLAFAVSAGILAGCSNAPKATLEQPVQNPKVQTTKDTLITNTERYSYALGMNLGRSLKELKDVGLDLSIMNQGIESQFDTSKKALMTDAEVEASLQTLLAELQTKREALAKQELANALAEEKAFLEKNAKDSSVITTPSGLQYKIIQTAEGLSPQKTDKVKVHYTGTLLNGTKFDSSYDRGEPLEFPVNAVIEGWQELLTHMKVGMKAKAWIPSKLGYGEAGAPPVIPGNSLLIFEVELLNVEAKEAPKDTLIQADSLKAVEDSVQAKQDSSKTEAPAELKQETEKTEEKKPETVQTKEEKPAETKAAPKEKEAAKPAEKKN